MAAAPFSVLAKLSKRVVEFVWAPLQDAYGRSTKERPTKLKLVQVKFFGDLATRGQNDGAALWNVSGGNAAGKDEARKVFSDMAKRIINLTD